MGRRSWVALLVVLVLGGAVPAALAAEGAPVPAQTPVVVPATLQALEQKMEQIRFNTARLSVRSVLGEIGYFGSGVELGSDTKCIGIVSSGTTLLELAPSESRTVTIVSVSTSKQLRTEERQIGRTRYTYRSDAARHDGGRPWVRNTTPKHKPKLKVSGLSIFTVALSSLDPTLSSTEPNRTGPFAGLIEEVNEDALSIREVGPTIVDGQQVTEFATTIDIEKLLAKHFSRTQIEKTGKQVADETVALDFYLAPSGMPVRTIGVMATHGEGIGVEEDVLAVGVPVVVHAPPAQETIGAARLGKIEKRRFEKLDKRLKPSKPREGSPSLGELSPKEPEHHTTAQCPTESLASQPAKSAGGSTGG
jgi:hypothetical protein